MKSDDLQLRSRGYIENHELDNYRGYDKEQLLNLLQSNVAAERTVAIRLLSSYRDSVVLERLISSLTNEKKLYTKIALSEEISTFGSDASWKLIKALGSVGSNQHSKLPTKPFEKNNYPLPRDIIARTICKVGRDAFEALGECLRTGTYAQLLEAVDAIGFISYYEKDKSMLSEILALFDKYTEDDVMIWKLLRALQSFSDDKSIDILNHYIDSDINQHQWEAKRSLEQIRRRTSY